MWMPKCPTKLLFNIDCPGCGFQRAIHAIIHGEFKRAFSLNPFLFLAAPYAIIAFSYEPNILDVEAYYKNGEKTSHATTLPVFPFDLRSVSVRSPFRLRSISVSAPFDLRSGSVMEARRSGEKPLWKRGDTYVHFTTSILLSMSTRRSPREFRRLIMSRRGSLRSAMKRTRLSRVAGSGQMTQTL